MALPDSRGMPWIAAGFAAILFLFLLFNAARFGYSRSLGYEATRSDSLPLADKAIRICPSDPEVHYYRATVLKDLGKRDEAAKELEEAVSLRPRSYILTLKLAVARDQLNDLAGSLTAYKEAVRLAPHYALPRWYLGRFLLRTGQVDQAFAQLRTAANSDPQLGNDLVRLALGAFGDDTRQIEEALQPSSAHEIVLVARSFADSGHTEEAMALFANAQDVPEEERQAFLGTLLKAKRFPEAYNVWSKGRSAGPGYESFVNGDFEDSIALDEVGFGWQINPKLDAVQVFSDLAEPHSGRRSLRLDFNGYAHPTAHILSEIILVKPNTHYQLSFSVRALDLATLGPPSVSILDASDEKTSLAPPVSATPGTYGWTDRTIQFATSGSANAILISIQRQGCSSAPCAIYGHFWLDSFLLKRL
jgi:tetratricopeptide (TPR) repeat protein